VNEQAVLSGVGSLVDTAAPTRFARYHPSSALVLTIGARANTRHSSSRVDGA
jgi:hypothetical protein